MRTVLTLKQNRKIYVTIYMHIDIWRGRERKKKKERKKERKKRKEWKGKEKKERKKRKKETKRKRGRKYEKMLKINLFNNV